jgi:hypothetical protein
MLPINHTNFFNGDKLQITMYGTATVLFAVMSMLGLKLGYRLLLAYKKNPEILENF